MKNSNNNATIRIDWVIIDTCAEPLPPTTLAQDIRAFAVGFAFMVAFGVALVAGCAAVVAIAHMIA